MVLAIKRIYAPISDDDGERIFVDRLWARGISKEKAKLTDWVKTIAPSTEVRQRFGHDPAGFSTFKRAYDTELDENPQMPAFIAQIKAGLAHGNVTLVYGAKDEQHNNAVVLLAYLQDHLTK